MESVNLDAEKSYNFIFTNSNWNLAFHSKINASNKVIYGLFVCLFLVQQPPVDQGLLIHEVFRSHTTTHHSQ